MLVLALCLAVAYLVVKPSGYYYSTPPAALNSPVGLLRDVDFDLAHDEWQMTDWSSKDGDAASAYWLAGASEITMGVSGYEASFYAVGVGQGYGADSLWPQPDTSRRINVEVNGSCHNVFKWRGTVNNASTMPVGCFGVGLNLWFDVILQDGSKLPVEMNIFFYQQGVNALPVGSFKDYGLRGNFFDGLFEEPVPAPWRFFYFHPFQLTVGEVGEFTFELNDYVDVVKSEAGEPYANGRFIFCGANVVLEVFMGGGEFTVDYCSFEQAK